MITSTTNDSSASGFIEETFEGFSQIFTDIEVIHSSEMNVVSKAKRYGRWWLLKGLKQEIMQKQAYRQRLRKEVEIMLNLQHPNIVSVVGLEKVEMMGDNIIMEFVEGKTLENVLQEGMISQIQKRQMADELINAMEYMHSKGIVHRDLKPANLMVTAYGSHIKIIDFG